MPEKLTNEPKCASCGVAWTEHLGATGLCEQLTAQSANESRLRKEQDAIKRYLSVADSLDALCCIERCVYNGNTEAERLLDGPPRTLRIELAALRERVNSMNSTHSACSNSVVEACVNFPNVASYIKQVERERDAAESRVKELEAEKAKHCPDCSGSGSLGIAPDGRLIACETCGGHKDALGTGRVDASDRAEVERLREASGE